MHVISKKALREFWEIYSDMLVEEIQTHWRFMQPILSIRSEKEYDNAVKTLNSLIDEVGTDEEHPLYELLDTMGTLINAYEEKHYSIPDCSGFEILNHLMTEHNVEPEDLPFLGPPNRVKKILDGSMALTIKEIHTLAERFHVNPAVFL